LWALEWACHSTETNLRAGISGICMRKKLRNLPRQKLRNLQPNLNSLTLLFPRSQRSFPRSQRSHGETDKRTFGRQSAFIRTDGGAKSTRLVVLISNRLVILINNIYTLYSETLPSTCGRQRFLLPSFYPFTLRTETHPSTCLLSDEYSLLILSDEPSMNASFCLLHGASFCLLHIYRRV